MLKAGKCRTVTVAITTAIVTNGKPSQPLTYTRNYANIRYQANTENTADLEYQHRTNNITEKSLINSKDTSTSVNFEDIEKGTSNITEDGNKPNRKTKLNIGMEKEREEVTEESSRTIPNDHSEITTERESEQINFARLQNRNINKSDKLQGDNENDDIEENVQKKSTELIEPAELIDLNMGENIPVAKKYIKSDKLVIDANPKHSTENKNSDESSPPEHLEALEVSDLNNQDIYYIYHPNGLLQKVVYAPRYSVENGELAAQVDYGNVAPIVESVFAYDPTTFVFQRFQVLNSS